MAETGQELNHDSVVLRILDKIIYMFDGQRIRLLHQLEEETAFSPQKNEREDTRKPYNTNVYFTSQGLPFSGFCLNISIGGMLIETSENFSIGQLIMLTIPFSDDTKKINAPAEIVRIDKKGIGVKFIKKINLTDD